MVLNQPALSKVQWQAEVEKMRLAYRAPVDPKDVDAIVAYLVRIAARTNPRPFFARTGEERAHMSGPASGL